MVSGRTAIDFSVGPILYHLTAMCDFVEKITVLKVNDGSLKELEKWKNKDADACDWAHATEILQELKGNSEESEDKEENLRGKIHQILKWDPSKCDPADLLLLSKADIAINISILEMISKDHDDYRRNLSKMCNVIKPGGYLLSYSPSNASYFKVGEDTYHFLPCDESFLRKVISERGFEIEHFKIFDRVMCSDIADHERVMFIIARKVKKM
ncbi:hypothetical protein GDO78_020272 [Eleutherodactylus coqui]|uniref:Nicotinamide N-methyltransferase n=1 Tax=Eleutherodactylus coqui TaxID=57060 RepID=A0A8J6BBN8_ELECQ|nr:hypothetical protein GDO78_020272 [Eleutherodactylus coqui]